MLAQACEDGDTTPLRHGLAFADAVQVPRLVPWHTLYTGFRFACCRYPAWFLAAVLIAIYMVIFTYGRALYWSDKVGDCLGDPTECFNNVAGQ